MRLAVPLLLLLPAASDVCYWLDAIEPELQQQPLPQQE